MKVKLEDLYEIIEEIIRHKVNQMVNVNEEVLNHVYKRVFMGNDLGIVQVNYYIFII